MSAVLPSGICRYNGGKLETVRCGSWGWQAGNLECESLLSLFTTREGASGAAPAVYLDEARSFGGALDHGQTRLKVYEDVLDRAMAAAGLVPKDDAGQRSMEVLAGDYCCGSRKGVPAS